VSRALRRSPARPEAAERVAAPVRRQDRRSGLTLIELLVVIAIGSVVTGALLTTWFALGDSYSMTTSSTKAREFARDAVARLGRELRDAEPAGTDPALRSVTTDEIVFTTTFNDPDNELVDSEPILTRYWYEWDAEKGSGALHRQRDMDNDGLFEADGVTVDADDRDTVVVRNVLNEPGTDGHADVFAYSYIDASGSVVEQGSSPETTSLPTIFLVHVTLSVDLNPESAPAPMQLSTTVQLRNQSRF
jgi:prepilin-type N-terminal cleavage/methylation domain-containing protein